MGLGKVCETAVSPTCAVYRLSGLEAEAGRKTSVQFAECNPLYIISHLLAVSHIAFYFFIAVSNT